MIAKVGGLDSNGQINYMTMMARSQSILSATSAPSIPVAQLVAPESQMSDDANPVHVVINNTSHHSGSHHSGSHRTARQRGTAENKPDSIQVNVKFSINKPSTGKNLGYVVTRRTQVHQKTSWGGQKKIPGQFLNKGHVLLPNQCNNGTAFNMLIVTARNGSRTYLVPTRSLSKRIGTGGRATNDSQFKVCLRISTTMTLNELKRHAKEKYIQKYSEEHGMTPMWRISVTGIQNEEGFDIADSGDSLIYNALEYRRETLTVKLRFDKIQQQNEETDLCTVCVVM